MYLNEVLNRFQKVKAINSSSYQCCCPCHNDKKQSLTITEKGNKILLHCHANCDTEDILKAVGLDFKDLDNSKDRKKDYSVYEKIEYYQKSKIEDIYNYTDEKGRYLYTKIRFKGKVIRYYVVDEKNGTYKIGKGDNIKTYPYNIVKALRAIKKGKVIYLCEGEKDVKNVEKLGFNALTFGSVSDYKEEFNKYFIGARLVILADNDEVGRKYAYKIKFSLTDYCYFISIITPSKKEHGDISDYIEEFGSEEAKELLNNYEPIYAPFIINKGDRNKLSVNAGLLAHSITKSLAYIIINDFMYIYNNGYYRKSSKNEVKSYIASYLPHFLRSDNLLNNVYNLLLAEMEFIRNPDEVNTETKYINFRNGLYNIEKKELEPHRKDIIYTFQINTNYNKDEKEPIVFTKYINDLCSDNGEVDEDKKKLLQEFGGLALSNIQGFIYKKMLFLYSPIGNTGKSQYISLISRLVGLDRVSNIPLQNMNEDKGRFVLANIGSVRLIANGDLSSEKVANSAILKSLTGGDTVKTEAKGKDIKTDLFKGLILYGCNDLPYIADDKGEHIYNRFIVCQCKNEIAEDKRDGNILDKMMNEKDAIASFFIEGLHRLIENKRFTIPKGSNECIEDYRKTSDTLYSFILDRGYKITKNRNDKISKRKFIEEYEKYCEEEDRTAVTSKNISARLEKLTGHKISRLRDNYIRDYFILGIEENDDFLEVDELEQVPFLT